MTSLRLEMQQGRPRRRYPTTALDGVTTQELIISQLVKNFLAFCGV